MTTGEERAVLRLPLLRALLAQGLALALVVVLVYLLALLPWRGSPGRGCSRVRVCAAWLT